MTSSTHSFAIVTGASSGIGYELAELYLERGEQSDEHQNWLDAEREISGESAQPTSEQTRAASIRRES